MKIHLSPQMSRFRDCFIDENKFTILDSGKADLVLCAIQEVDDYKEKNKSIFSFVLSNNDIDAIEKLMDISSIKWDAFLFEEIKFPLFSINLNNDSKYQICYFKEKSLGVRFDKVFYFFILIPEIWRIFKKGIIFDFFSEIFIYFSYHSSLIEDGEIFPGFIELKSTKRNLSHIKQIINLFQDNTDYETKDVMLLIENDQKILEYFLNNKLLIQNEDHIKLNEEMKEKLGKIQDVIQKELDEGE